MNSNRGRATYLKQHPCILKTDSYTQEKNKTANKLSTRICSKFVPQMNCRVSSTLFSTAFSETRRNSANACLPRLELRSAQLPLPGFELRQSCLWREPRVLWRRGYCDYSDPMIERDTIRSFKAFLSVRDFSGLFLTSARLLAREARKVIIAES